MEDGRSKTEMLKSIQNILIRILVIIIAIDLFFNFQILNEKKQTSKLEDYVIENNEYANERVNQRENKIQMLVRVVSVPTIITFLATFIYTRKIRIKREYVRDTEQVVEPIMAEAIIDKKVGIKELIMSCIVKLIYKGNLKNIGKDKIEFIKYDNMTEYEKEIINLVFGYHGKKVISFEEIKQMFIYDNKNTYEFFSKYKQIRERIESNIFDAKIYSKKGENILKFIRIICMILIANSLYLLGYIIFREPSTIAKLISYNIISTFIITYCVIKKCKIYTIINKSRWFNIMMCLALMLIMEFQKNDIFMSEILILIIINIITYQKTNTHIFTKKGKIEYAKACGLKNYIEDYSLIEDRDIDSSIIWDEYLAYAVAFKIPNKITDKFGENIIKTNVVLQKIEEFLKI